MLWLCRVTDDPSAGHSYFLLPPCGPKKITYDRFKVSKV